MKKTVFLILFLLIFPFPTASAEITRPATVKIFSTGNLHGHADAVFDRDGHLLEIGYARMKNYIGNQKADLRLLLDAGDVFFGSALAGYSDGRSIAELVGAMGYAAITPGLHDFDLGYDALQDLAANSGVNLLGINGYEDEELAFKPYIVYDLGGLKIGVLGLISPDIDQEGLRFDTDSIARCKAIVRELKNDMEVDAVIALTHLGVHPMDGINARNIAQEVTGIDVIIDGGSHEVVAGEAINGTVLISSGEYFHSFSEITLNFHPDTGLAIDAQILDATALRGVPDDIGMGALLDDLLKPVTDRGRETVGEAPIELNGRTEALRSGETNLGRLITSALKTAANSDIAIISANDIGASLMKGSVHTGDLRAVLLYSDDIVVVQMTGEAIWKTLNRNFVLNSEKFPHFAGMTAEVFLSEEQKNTGTQYNYRLNHIEIGGEGIDLRRVYTVALPRRLYETILSKEYPIIDNSGSLEDAVADYLPDADFLALNAERRLRVVDPPEHFSNYNDTRPVFQRLMELVNS